MKIVVTCGHPYSDFQLAYESLTQAGLGRTQPSRRESLSPTELHEKIFKAYDLDPLDLNVNTAIRPGKVWQDLAVDLFVGNMEQKNWGWADDKSVWLLEFWKELDPQVHFVLVYSAPEFAIGKALIDNQATPGRIESVLASWIAYHTEILRFYNRNPERSLLVNAAATIHDPETFIEKTINMFGMDLTLPSCEQLARIDSVTAIAATLSKALIDDDSEAYALYHELESAADIAGPKAIGSNVEKRHALEEFTALLAGLDKAKIEISEKAQYINKLQDEQIKLTAELKSTIQRVNLEREKQTKLAAAQQTELQQLTQAQNEQAKLVKEQQAQIRQLTQTQQEFESFKEEHATLTCQLNDLQAKLKDEQTIAQNKQVELTQEKELLLLQLHQVQEELELYFLQMQELGQARDEQTKLAADRQTQIQKLTQSRDEQTKLAAERQAQIQKLTQSRDEQTKLAAERQAQIQKLTQLRDEQTKLATERQAQIQKLTQSRDEQAKLATERQAQIQKLTQARDEQDKLAAERQAELTQENELLLLQLHQVQEELERYFLQVQELTQARDEQTKSATERQAQILKLTQSRDEQIKLATERQAQILKLTQSRDEQTKLATERQAQIQKLTQARDEQTKLATERQAQIQKLTQARDEQTKLATERQAQIQKLTQARDEQTKLATERQTQIQKLMQSRDEQTKLATERQAQIQKLTQSRDEQAKLAAERLALAIPSNNLAELTQENELLLLQLHQVQEELEHYFLQWQELSDKEAASAEVTTAFINRFWCKHQPSEVVIDFRDDIEGDNWYDAEPDGRWAGPGKVSTVKLPALRKGRYELYLDIVDAKAPEIITGLDLSLNGARLQTTVDGEGYPAMVYSEFTVKDVVQHPVWEFQFKFPKLISPAEQGVKDNRHLAIRVRTLKLRVTA